MAKKLKYPYEQWKQEQERSTEPEHLEASNHLASMASESGPQEHHSKYRMFFLSFDIIPIVNVIWAWHVFQFSVKCSLKVSKRKIFPSTFF